MIAIFVGMAFLDSNVPDDVKTEMMTTLVHIGIDQPFCHIELDTTPVYQKSLSDFVTVNTIKLFVALDIPQTILSQHLSTWEKNNIFLQAHGQIQTLQLVNDAAECGVAHSIIQRRDDESRRSEKAIGPNLLQVEEKLYTIVGCGMPVNIH